MQQLAIIVFIVVLAVIVGYAVFQYSPPGFTFKNIFSGFKIPTSTNPFAGGGQTRYFRGSAAPASGTYIAPPAQPQVNPSDIPSGFTLQDLSPYFKKITVSASPGSFGYYSQVTLYGYSAENSRTNITGWQLRANRGGFYIPRAVDVYDPSGLATESDINLKNGDVLYIYSTTSGVGRNLHLNKCIGYITNSNVFNPQLSLNCPYINRSEISHLTGQCQNYILSLGSCKLPAPHLPFLINDYNCQIFLDKINYGGCFARHRNDSDFLSNQWIVWSGSQFLDFQHDRLLLFDKESLLVNEYSY